MRSVKTQRFWVKTGEIPVAAPILKIATSDNLLDDEAPIDADWDDEDWNDDDSPDDDPQGHEQDTFEGLPRADNEALIAAIEAENEQLREHLNRVLAMLRDKPAPVTTTMTAPPLAPAPLPLPLPPSHGGVEKRNLDTRAWTATPQSERKPIVAPTANSVSSNPASSDTASSDTAKYSSTQYTPMSARGPASDQPLLGNKASIATARNAMTGISSNRTSKQNESASELLRAVRVPAATGENSPHTDPAHSLRLSSLERQVAQLERRVGASEQTIAQLLGVIAVMVA